MLHDMSGQELSDTFAAAWGVARRHLQAVSQGSLGWLHSTLHEPLITHLAFRLGNQLFFVFVEVEGGVAFEGRLQELFLQAAEAADAHACLFPVATTDEAAGPQPTHPGWGLVSAVNHAPVEPPALVSGAPVEMSDWEVHDFATRLVREQLKKTGVEVLSWQPNLGIYPTLWVEHQGAPNWVVVRGVRWPSKDGDAAVPPAIEDMKSRLPGKGYIARVIVANGEQDVASTNLLRLHRGQALMANYQGMEPL